MEDCWKLHHIAYVVRDMDRAIQHHQNMGLELMAKPVLRTWGGERVLIYSKPMDPPMKYNFCLLKKSTFIIELFQPIGEGYIWTDFLDCYGEGIQHLHFDVDNLEVETAKMLNAGFEIAFSIKRLDGTLREAFFDTSKIGKTMIALYHNTSEPRFPGYLTAEQSANLRLELNH